MQRMGDNCGHKNCTLWRPTIQLSENHVNTCKKHVKTMLCLCVYVVCDIRLFVLYELVLSSLRTNFIFGGQRFNQVTIKPISKSFGRQKPFKNNEKNFLFYLKNSFRSEDILIFVSPFWSCTQKKRLGRKIRLVSKFMTSQPG